MTSNRERYKAIARFERTGDLWMNDLFWPEVLVLWMQDGAPGGIFANPEAPMCRFKTVSVSAQARMMGSQCGSKTEG